MNEKEDRKTEKELAADKAKAQRLQNLFPQNKILGQYGKKKGPGAEPMEEAMEIIRALAEKNPSEPE